MRHGIDQDFAQRLDRIFVQPHTIEPHHFHGVPRVAADEGDGAVHCERHGTANVFVVAGSAVGLRPSVSIRQNPTLREHGRRIASKQYDARSGREVFPSDWIAPKEPAQRCAGEQYGGGKLIGIAAFGGSDQTANDLMVEFFPTQPGKGLRFEFEASLQGLVGRSRFEFVEHRGNMRGQKCVGVQKILNDDTLIFEFFLHGTDEYAESLTHGCTPVSGKVPAEISRMTSAIHAGA